QGLETGRVAVQAEQPQLGALGATVVRGHDDGALSWQIPPPARLAEGGEQAPAAVRGKLIQLSGAGLVVADQQPPGIVDIKEDGRAQLDHLAHPVIPPTPPAMPSKGSRTVDELAPACDHLGAATSPPAEASHERTLGYDHTRSRPGRTTPTPC